MKYVPGLWENHLHWACEKCIVRSMCKDNGCYMTEYLHDLCTSCKINHLCMMDKDCEEIKDYKLWERMGETHGEVIKDLILKQLKETSGFYRLISIPKEETDLTWWYPNGN